MSYHRSPLKLSCMLTVCCCSSCHRVACVCGLQAGRRSRPTHRVKEAVLDQRVANLVKNSLRIEKSQKKLQEEKLTALMGKITQKKN